MYTCLRLSAKDMYSQEVTLNPNNVFASLKTPNSSKHRFGFSKESTSSLRSIQCENLCAKCLKVYWYLEETNDKSEYIIRIRNSDSLLRYQKFRDQVSWIDQLFSCRNEMDFCSYDSDETILPMKKETGEPETVFASSGFTEKSYACDSYNREFNRCMQCRSKIRKDNKVNLAFEIEKDFEESFKKISKSDEMTDVHTFRKSTNLQLQNKSADENYFIQTIVKSMESAMYDELFTPERYTEENLLPKISDKSEKLPNRGDSFEVPFPDNYPIEAENDLKKLEVSDDIIEDMDYDKEENDKYNYISSNITPNNPDHQSRQCDSKEDNCSLEYLLSVFDFLRETEAANYFTTEENAFISSQSKEPEYVVSSFFCVQSVRFLLSCLDNVDDYLMEKEKEANKLKLDFESSAKALESINRKKLNNKKYKMYDEAKNLISSCDKLLVDLKKDRVECDWYSKNIHGISNFLQGNCLNQKL